MICAHIWIEFVEDTTVHHMCSCVCSSLVSNVDFAQHDYCCSSRSFVMMGGQSAVHFDAASKMIWYACNISLLNLYLLMLVVIAWWRMLSIAWSQNVLIACKLLLIACIYFIKTNTPLLLIVSFMSCLPGQQEAWRRAFLPFWWWWMVGGLRVFLTGNKYICAPHFEFWDPLLLFLWFWTWKLVIVSHYLGETNNKWMWITNGYPISIRLISILIPNPSLWYFVSEGSFTWIYSSSY